LELALRLASYLMPRDRENAMDTHMDSHHVHHLDEISVWSWVAAAAFGLIAIAAILMAAQDKITVATGITNPSLPLMQPALMPSDIIEPRA
jgi:hypothetical protein